MGFLGAATPGRRRASQRTASVRGWNKAATERRSPRDMYTAARACARAPRRAKKRTARGNRTPTARAKATSPPIRPERFVDAGAAPQSRLTTTLRWRTALPAEMGSRAALSMRAAAAWWLPPSWRCARRLRARVSSPMHCYSEECDHKQSGLFANEFGFCDHELCRHVRLLLVCIGTMPSRADDLVRAC